MNAIIFILKIIFHKNYRNSVIKDIQEQEEHKRKLKLLLCINMEYQDRDYIVVFLDRHNKIKSQFVGELTDILNMRSGRGGLTIKEAVDLYTG